MSFLNLTVESTGSGRRTGKKRAQWEAYAMFVAAGITQPGTVALQQEAAVRLATNNGTPGKLPEKGLSKREVASFWSTTKQGTVSRPNDWEALVKLEEKKLAEAKASGFANLEVHEYTVSVGEGQTNPDVIKSYVTRPATEAERQKMIAFFESVDIDPSESEDSDAE